MCFGVLNKRFLTPSPTETTQFMDGPLPIHNFEQIEIIAQKSISLRNTVLLALHKGHTSFSVKPGLTRYQTTVDIF